MNELSFVVVTGMLQVDEKAVQGEKNEMAHLQEVKCSSFESFEVRLDEDRRRSLHPFEEANGRLRRGFWCHILYAAVPRWMLVVFVLVDEEHGDACSQVELVVTHSGLQALHWFEKPHL